MKKLSIIAIILASLAIAGEAFIFATHKESGDELHVQAIRTGYHVYAPSIPDTLTFAGERVPLNIYYVREGLDRELVSNMYFQSNTLFMIKRATRFFPTIERILKEIASEEASEKAVEALSSRNRPRLTALAKEYPDCAGAFGKLAELSSLTGSNGEVLSDLRAMGADEELVSELESVVSALDEDAVRIDFSVLGGMKYYNGIIFRGYVEGVPVPVLSGGQYDRLMRRMGKRSGAIGFAVYMDPLERMLQAGSEYDVDTVLLYSEGDDMKKVLEKADSLRSGNRSVMTLRKIPSDLRYRDIVGGADA